VSTQADVVVIGADIKRLHSQDALLAIMKDGSLHEAPATTAASAA
jgi:hypothetical protein